MADFVLHSSYYPSVRAAISVDVDDVSLPDTTIALAIYKGEAERFVMRGLSEAQYTHVDYVDDASHAAVLYLASLLIPALPVVVSERIAGGNVTYQTVDQEQRIADLQEMANDRINDIKAALPGSNLPTVSSNNPNLFGVARRRLTY